MFYTNNDLLKHRYLEEDPSVTVVERRGILRGYELYLVEQWACSRQSPTLVVVTYTGDQRNSVAVGVLAVPSDETLWSPRLQLYFKATRQYHARPKETDLGELMITNLSSFPSSLTVIPVPDGDIKQHRQAFIVNEDLKRLGCSGRSGMTLTDPAEATQAKFQQLYRTSERIPFMQSVTELVKLCQVALYMFEKLDHEYIDGLLCDVTERAVSNWWIEVGAEHYNFEPTDGILGPSSVAALLGMLLGARNRLQWYGAPVSKDVFDIESTKRGIAYFQKSQKLEKTRRLDRQTLFRLHTATAKAVAGEGWGVQKAVKSTMTEIGGKRGELVLDMVSGKDKAGLAEIETLDIDRFASLAYGERPKWLWHGKPRRTFADYHSSEHDLSNVILAKDNSLQAAKRVQSLPAEEELELRRKEDSLSAYPSASVIPTATFQDGSGDKDALRKNMLRSVAGKVSDARGRIKDAVGGSRRGPTTRPSVSTRDEPGENGSIGIGLAPAALNSAMLSSPSLVNRTFTWKNKPEEYLAAMKRGEADDVQQVSSDGRDQSSSSVEMKMEKAPTDDVKIFKQADHSTDRIGREIRQEAISRAPSEIQSAADEADLQGSLLLAEYKTDMRSLAFGRRHSLDLSALGPDRLLCSRELRWPRRLSFSDAEEAILGWEDVIDDPSSADATKMSEIPPEIAFHLKQSIKSIVDFMEPWVEQKLGHLQSLNERYARDQNELQQLYSQLKEAYRRVRYSSDELLAEERAQLTESVKEIEVLAQRLDYEINGLVQRVNDVEDGVLNFERQVDDVESRAEELKMQLETEGWLHWFVRTLTGIGTGPNITRMNGK
jgi:hypothetical protein